MKKISLLIFVLFNANQVYSSEEIIFAGGCFWCIEAPFDKTPGVISAESGYINGRVVNPSYKQVSAGSSGHVEAVKVIYDPTKVSLKEIFELFWQSFDPTDAGGSFYDRGPQYSSAVFYNSKEQKRIAEESIKFINTLKVFSKEIVTPIIRATKFYKAEEYHQNYHKKNPSHYKRYRKGSGRDNFIKKHWGKKKLHLPNYIFTRKKK
ncbi:MAG: peptide-methionine (S)-S-oxide reductase MsrA [Bacteriovoracaceae bacterium]|jgi:peptide methionine sulfoxide reductase msrA/msrB|nr:peptide-methionine (S)-S-oxide reductase MsrA [Bacteriovoracaceae bacterium]